MKREERLKHCRYYKGEEDYPEGKFGEDIPSAFFYWEAEEIYVNRFETDPEFAKQAVADCFRENLVGLYLDIPLELLACLYATYVHTMGGGEYSAGPYFEHNFMPKYLAQPL
ncbi:MAG: hypothetical protein IKP62_04410 [Salinivirgaceae bacterium]|nr:hypothetical protein [Salinivirgaceae bacterium]